MVIALIPCVTLLGLGGGATVYLLDREIHAEDWAIQLKQITPPIAAGIEAFQQERRQSIQRIAGDDSATYGLTVARSEVDNLRKMLESIGASLGDIDADALGAEMTEFWNIFGEIYDIRARLDAGTLSQEDAYNFYNRVIDAYMDVGSISHRRAPNAETALRLSQALALSRVAEFVDRGAAVLSYGLLPGDSSTAAQLSEYMAVTGYYHTESQQIIRRGDTFERTRLQAVLGSESWRRLDLMMEAVLGRGTSGLDGQTVESRSGPSGDVRWPVAAGEWAAAAATVESELMAIWREQNQRIQQTAAELGAKSAREALFLGGGVLGITLVALLAALLLSNRLIGRLQQLRRDTLALADIRLPDVVRRLGDGERVDPATAIVPLDFGDDEIGQVAEAFNRAQLAAVGSATAEAETRAGVNAVFLDIAHRSQVIVRRQLEVLDEAERQVEDPVQLGMLFELDHLATRARRNAENLTILGGAQPGRQWRNSVPLIDVVRSAIAETLEYTRVSAKRMPDIEVVGGAVTDIVHLIAELVDNATGHSPSTSPVVVSGAVVAKGVAVEISDQGLGMSRSELDESNALLASPPAFGLATASGEFRLGLFVVARLAMRQGVAVRLTESDYGGIRAVVLIPSGVIAEAAVPPEGSVMIPPGAH
ncbi:sensor histidine kinase [Nocardia noduli]|uniref:sensor histidine kinase n=1 Tax=Nocardia noduli TaxID=2815722 RepID=UPI001C24A881|nr:nitrate- and nitrite sensing domain-containing protein [Nocardia noduli]